MTHMAVLFPHEMFAPRKVDAHFEAEHAACAQLGVPTGLFDQDVPAPVGQVPDQPALVRGWMFTLDGYTAFHERVTDSGAALVTSPAHYARAHTLPGWYAAARAVTPASVWASTVDELIAAAAALPAGPGIIKDHVKSLKHLWDTHCYVPDVHDPAAVRRVAEAYVTERGDRLQGGLVLRAFEEFTGAEARTWWRDGRHVLSTAHPDTPEDLPDDVPADIAAAAVAELDCPFITVDFARRADGTWRVIEIGDGGVSDRPRSADPEQFARAVLR